MTSVAPLKLSPEQRRRVDVLLDELLDLAEEARPAHLQSRQGEERVVMQEVESLLKAAKASGDFLSGGNAGTAPAPDSPPDVLLGARLGAWHITRLIGRGGMGEVYEAKRADGSFEQRVAIKLLQREAAEQLERFQAERQILAN